MNHLQPAGLVRDYYLELNGIRGIAAIWVMFFHFQYGFNKNPDFYYAFFDNPIVNSGYLAVDVFFILSGFVLTLKAFEWDGHRIGVFYKDFLARRFARIYPLHFVTTVAMIIIVMKVIPPLQNGNLLHSAIAHLLLVNAWGHYFLPDLNYPTWSLSTELIAYFLFPAMFLLNRQIFSSSLLKMMAIIFAFAFFMNTAIGYFDGEINQTVIWGAVRCLSEFWIGMNLFYLHKSLSRGWAMAFGFACLSLGTWQVYFFFGESLAYFSIIPFGIAIIMLLTARIKIFSWLFGNRMFDFLGNISYSIYLLHVPVGLTILKLLGKKWESTASTITGFAALAMAVATTVILSAFSFYIFERWTQKRILGFFFSSGQG